MASVHLMRGRGDAISGSSDMNGRINAMLVGLIAILGFVLLFGIEWGLQLL
jgi:hypothetical protein